MASLYERIAQRGEGARFLAAARLRREVLKILHRALAAAEINQVELAARLGVRKSAVNQVLNGDGNVRITTLAEYLHACGHEATLALVPAGQPRQEVLARREAVAIARRTYPSAETHASVLGVFVTETSHGTSARAWTANPHLTGTTWSHGTFPGVYTRDPKLTSARWHPLPSARDLVRKEAAQR